MSEERDLKIIEELEQELQLLKAIKKQLLRSQLLKSQIGEASND